MKSITSLNSEELPVVKDLISDLHPWPLSNEEAWEIAWKYVGPLVEAKEDASNLFAVCDKVIAEQKGRIEKAMLKIETISDCLEEDDIAKDYLEIVLRALQGEEAQ